MIPPYTFNTCPSIRFGEHSINNIGAMVREIGHERALIVSDQGMVSSGIVQKISSLLNDDGVEVDLFTDVVADPPETVVNSAVHTARLARSNMIIGLGGGSSLDVAKLVALLVPKHQSLIEAYGIGNAIGPRLPLILVPTTAGTGSEVTPIAIVTTGESEKMGVVSPVIIPDIAVLDPLLTVTVPKHVTAATGIDAMVHAIEAYASTSDNNNPVSRQLALQALELLGGAVEDAVKDGSNREARANMLLGSMLAGQAFANSPVAAVHALAYPIGGHFKIPHGLSNALVLSHVLRFNSVVAPMPYAEMAPHVFPHLAELGTQKAASAFAEELAELGERCGLETRLRDVGIPAEAIDRLASDAMNQTRLLTNNPRPLNESDARSIYQAAW